MVAGIGQLLTVRGRKPFVYPVSISDFPVTSVVTPLLVMGQILVELDGTILY